jgi:hypothetical protein
VITALPIFALDMRAGEPILFATRIDPFSRHVIKWSILTGFVLHLLLSALWIVAFAAGMTAFGSGEGVWLAKALGVVLSVFYAPVLLAARLGLCEANIGPYPSFGTVIWCVIVGAIAYKLRQAIEERRTWVQE